MENKPFFDNHLSNTITIDFKALLMELLDKLSVIILSGIAVGLAMFLLCSTVLHLNYESTTKIYIKPQGSDVSSAYVSLEVGSLLTTDYVELIKGRDILESAIKEFDLDTTYESFTHNVTVDNPTDTRFLVISVKNQDPYLARNLAVYIRARAISDIESKMGAEGISVIEQANLPVKNVISAKMLSLISAIICMLLVACFVAARYFAIDKIVSADDIEKRMNLQVLGTIAFEKKGRRA